MAEEDLREDQAFIEYIVRAIVDIPDKVRTERTIDERGVLITLYVDPSDMGKVIGKEGRTAKAIRSLLKVLGAKNQARVTMKIVEPEGGKPVSIGEDLTEDL
ncbi:KH domain-containing protein [Patescibacteria group bacterium]|nr:KH domain-containing protein [Patescibacteria group bacterium]